MTTVDIVYSQVWKQLKAKLESDSEFRKELEGILHFYGKKLILLAKKDAQKEFIENNLEDVIHSQYFQGYCIMRSMLIDQNLELPEEVWSLTPGVVRNELPTNFDEWFKDTAEDWTKTEVGHSFSMSLIQEIEGVFDVLKQLRKDVTLYGAYKAFIEDSRYKKVDAPMSDMLIGNPYDLQFLTPQVYMKFGAFSAENEVWDLYLWSSIIADSWVGTVHLTKIIQDIEQTFYILTFSVLDTIAQHEKLEMLNSIINSLPQSVRAILQIRVYHLSDIEVVVPAVQQ